MTRAFEGLLIVDDSSEVRILLRALFSGDFERIDEAADGQSAVRLLSSGLYSAVVLDLFMPVPGTALTDYATEREPAMLPRIVVVTAAPADAALIREVRAAGVATVVSKPFDTGELLSIVTSVAGGTASSRCGARAGHYVQ